MGPSNVFDFIASKMCKWPVVDLRRDMACLCQEQALCGRVATGVGTQGRQRKMGRWHSLFKKKK